MKKILPLLVVAALCVPFSQVKAAPVRISQMANTNNIQDEDEFEMSRAVGAARVTRAITGAVLKTAITNTAEAIVNAASNSIVATVGGSATNVWFDDSATVEHYVEAGTNKFRAPTLAPTNAATLFNPALVGTVTNTGFKGLWGANDLNMERQLHLPLRYRQGLPPRRLFFGDNSVMDSASTFGAIVVSNLSQATPRNGSIIGNSTYLYSAGDGTLYSAAWNNALAPWNYYGLEDGESFTNRTTQAPNGIPTTLLTVGYWAGNGFGTFDVYTNVVANGVFGARASVRTIDADNGGALEFVITNIPIALASIFASVAAHGATNIVQGQVGQYDTNLFAGHVTDWIAIGNMAWEHHLTNAYHSNWLRSVAAQYDWLGVVDKGPAERGMGHAEGLWSSAALQTDLAYIIPQATTNQLAASLAERSNVLYHAHIYARPAYDLPARFLPIEPSNQTALYTADAVHLSPAGAALAASHVVKDFRWQQQNYAALGYELSAADISGKANLAGGNAFSGTQTHTGSLQLSNELHIAGATGLINIWDQLDTSGNKRYQLRRIGTGFQLNDPASGNVSLFTVSNFAGTVSWNTAGTPVLGHLNPFQIHATTQRVSGHIFATNGVVAVPGSVSLTADNQVVGATTNAVLSISSDDATAGNRTFVLTTGITGKRLTLVWSGTNAGELVDDAANSGSGNVRLSATWTPTQYDVLDLIAVGNDWHEVARSAN